MTFRRGETFIASPDGSDEFHLFVVVSDPAKDPARVVVVNLTSVHNVWSDDMTCLLERGEHRFVKHKSRVAYEYAKEVTLTALDAALDDRLIFKNSDMPAGPLARITAGFGSSKRVPRVLRRILSNQGLLPGP